MEECRGVVNERERWMKCGGNGGVESGARNGGGWMRGTGGGWRGGNGG